MSYERNFNNTVAIWTAFGGRGSIILPTPTLNWQKKYYSDFGYTQYGSETQIDVHDNGNAQIAVYHAKTPYMSYFDQTTKQWTVVSVSWWSYGAPVILWAGDGVFLAKITGLANIIASFDGITWYNAGYCQGAQNSMTTGAYDTSRGSGVVSWWYYKSPVYYSFDSLMDRTAWTLVGADGTSVPIFSYMTAHQGNFIGIVGGDKSIAIASSATPGSWTTTIPEDLNETHYMYIRSINNKLFVMKYRYVSGVFHVKLCVMNDNATEITETNLSHVGDLADNRIPNPQNIIWMQDWGKYALFMESMLYVSVDGLTWEGVEQPGFTTTNSDTFGGAIYVPGDGFYVKASGYVYYAQY
ncbi:hypothetical protein [Robertmurraya andreesenii]|uniref:Uncharacterized protein n=1 Tax=Anoxybacillus andreesenii TaxID=1325932 RepID=A0ABT9UZM5_9BACL|nr:hypothetical protein [Robertmurraya andreesenii]MDQ0154144.1 hypothetical protein [Robertmurraya andreesenii]